jgi:hypothetical protein
MIVNEDGDAQERCGEGCLCLAWNLRAGRKLPRQASFGKREAALGNHDTPRLGSALRRVFLLV